ncbi:hypothetical protein [Photorhabdus caribbeanensis]|uniref:hypothetical protein n=1 Tax=Photorhabdus caribbeanensis TaxID=1004165 RepID=UPI001BD3D2B5|nr:hypothetical protein [Photorhabdus caribbeanensis]MBS9423350.1 hypothetical protein [Photorhabdus caribbeanensis]
MLDKIKAWKTFLLKKTSIDYHVGYSLTLRLWNILAGGILMLSIPFVFSLEEQGYYFTFTSIIALQVFFELGLNYVIVQLVAHEMAYLKYDKKVSLLIGDLIHIKRVHSLIKMLRKWYSIVSILFLLVVFIIGFYFFIRNGSLNSDKWVIPWGMLVFFSSVNLFISPFLSVLEGMGFVGEVAKIKLFQSILGYSTLILFFIFGFKLGAISAIPGIAAICSLLWIYKKYKNLFFLSNSDHICNELSWKRDIFPFQWKIAISWLSGYFIFQAIIPLIFAHQGEKIAGQVGLTMTVFSALLSLSMSWVSAKINVMGRLVASKDRETLNHIFIDITKKSGILNIFIILSFIFTLYFLKSFNFNIVNRFASLDIIFILSIVAIFNHLVFCFAAYMRSHKEEPMLTCSVIVALLTFFAVYFTSYHSATTTILSYSIIIVFISFPWSLWLFKKYYFSNK